MSNPAQNLWPNEVSLSYATVVSVGAIPLIRDETGLRQVAKPPSCLLEMAPGDRVLLCSDLTGEAYVLAIVARKAPGPMHVAVDADLNLEARAGKLNLIARDGIEIGSAGRVGIVSHSLDIHSVNAELAISRVSFLGSLINASVGTIRLVADVFDLLIQSIHQQSKRVFRRVEDIEHVKAKQLDYDTEEGISMRGQYALITAAKIVKVDGEQIQLG